MKLLYIGDVMGPMGVKAIEQLLPQIVQVEGVDFVVAQAENVTDGKGMSVTDYAKLKELGVDAFTGGNHTPARLDLYPLLENATDPVVGPMNMRACPGLGYKIVIKGALRVLVASLLGNTVGKQSEMPVENPLLTLDSLLAKVPRESYDISVVNLHGDYSSEKLVFAHYADGRISVTVGDHWHVQSADAEVTPLGTAHMTDVGMCGSLDSSLGVTYDAVIRRWRDGVKTKNELETSGRTQFSALLVDIDETTGVVRTCKSIRQVW